jgi:hypothetical protein
MSSRKSALRKTIKVVAVLTFLAFAYALVRASLYLGETNTVGLANLTQTLLLYLIGLVLAILAAVYFWPYPGLRGIKVFSVLVILAYGYAMISFPFRFGDTIEWTPPYLAFALAVFSLGLILAIWTMIYFRRMTEQ